MCIRRETREKARQSLAFSRVSKPHTHITHMLRQCTSIVYLSVHVLPGTIIWQLDFQLSVHSVPITTNIVSSNPIHGEVYSIQHYVIKFVSDLQQVGGFLWFLPPIKLTTII